MNFRKDFLLRESRKLAILAALFIFQQAVPSIQESLLKYHFQAPSYDFAYVLAVSFLPTIIYSAMSLLLFSFFVSILKMMFVPAYMLEKKYFGLKYANLVPIFIYSLLLMLVLYNSKYLGTASFSDYFGGIFSKIMNPPQSTLQALGYAVHVAVAVPLYIFYPLKVSSLVSGALYAMFIIHLISIRTIGRNANFSRACSSKISEEGGWISVETKLISKFPVLSYVRISHEFKDLGVVKKESVRSSSDISGMHIEHVNKYSLLNGFYSADMAEFWVITPPFFSKIYCISRTDASVTVVPKTPEMHSVRTSPVALESRGNLLSKKMMNSSTDFAGIKGYVPGDQLNRIWWQGFARTGTLLTKNYYSTGEDSIILMPDLTDANSGNEYNMALMSALTNIVNICSKKDISISVYPICSHELRAEASRNRKELMFFILNIGTITTISPKGADKIFESALSRQDYSRVIERCKKNNITLSSFYGASAISRKAAPVFSWDRKSVFMKSARNFFKHQGKRSKVVLLTDSSIPLSAIEDFRNMCLARKFRYAVIALEKDSSKKGLHRIEEAKMRHIFMVPMAFEDAKRLSKIYSVLGSRIL